MLELYALSQPTFTCSKSTMKAPEQCVKLLKVNNNDTRKMSMMSSQKKDFANCSVSIATLNT